MAQEINVSMPPDLDLPAGWKVRVTAVDTSGALVSGVNVSNMAIVADAPLGTGGIGGGGVEVGPLMLVPGPGA